MTSGLVVFVTLLGTWVVSILVLRFPGPIAEPVPDRWHRKSTPLTGGLALLAGFLAGLGAAVLAGHVDRRVAYDYADAGRRRGQAAPRRTTRYAAIAASPTTHRRRSFTRRGCRALPPCPMTPSVHA